MTLIALAFPARAQEAAPAAAATAAQPAANVTGAAAPAPAAQAAPAKGSAKRLQIGLAFLPMAKGTVTATTAVGSSTVDTTFATGYGLSVSYELFDGLSVGVAPQAIYNEKIKDSPADAGYQYDLLARIAYAYSIPDVLTLYAELLPGYSMVHPPLTSAKGLVVVFGVGANMDITDNAFLNLGVGYEKGYQKQSKTADYKTDFVRVVIGAGVKF